MKIVKNSFWSKLKKYFEKKTEKSHPAPVSMPSWENVVELMYDKGLDAFRDEVIRVIYSKDKSMRYVVLKDPKGYLTYQLEAIYQFNDEEWQYIRNNALPAMWEPYLGHLSNSIFDTEKNLMKNLKSEPEYKQYFSNDAI